MGAAVAAAIAASACCTIPFLLVSFGLGGVWVSRFTALEPMRPLFVALAVGALAYAGYREWRASRTPDCDCGPRMPTTTRRTLLGVVALLALGLVASPWIIKAATDSTETVRAQEAAPALAPPGATRAVLSVSGMTCASCTVTVKQALTAIPGVREALVTYEPAQAVVTYDPSSVTPEQLAQAVTEVGYPTRLTTTPL